MLLSQWYATIPTILGSDKQPLPGSIAQLERVELNDRDQQYFAGAEELTHYLRSRFNEEKIYIIGES